MLYIIYYILYIMRRLIVYIIYWTPRISVISQLRRGSCQTPNPSLAAAKPEFGSCQICFGSHQTFFGSCQTRVRQLPNSGLAFGSCHARHE